MDLAINGGLLMDPGNNICSKLNIGVNNGKISELSSAPLHARINIDAEGMAVTPGFIDAHMHEGAYDAEKECFDSFIFQCMLRMGVTTAIGGNCGSGPEDPAAYLDAADRLGLPVKLALLVPHNTLRKKAGVENKYSPVSLEKAYMMREQAESWLDSGCIGISFGIRYIPGIDENELNIISEAAVKGGRVIAAHIRDDSDRVIQSVKELTRIAECFGIPVQVSHIGSMAGYGQMDEVLALLDQYRFKGLDVAADCYPYTAFSTCIGETTYDDGFLERYGIGYESIEIAEGPYRGRRCTEELFRKLRAEAPDTITIGHVMKQAEIDKAVIHPGIIIGSDGFMHGGQGHPRAAGTFPRVLSEYVKKRRLISLCEAIGKMTWKTARRFGIPGGDLSIGSSADIVVFRPETIEDKATFDNPAAAPAGIEYVLLDGKIALKQGEIVNNTLGRAIRK